MGFKRENRFYMCTYSTSRVDKVRVDKHNRITFMIRKVLSLNWKSFDVMCNNCRCSLTPQYGHFAPLNYTPWSVGKQCISITRLRDHYKVNLRVDQSKHNIKVNNQSFQIKIK